MHPEPHRYRYDHLRRDVLAAVAVTFMAIPQGVAYALIAGLPPSVGLYAACLPAIVGSVFRSSRHVITGPTNALSLLVGGAVAASSDDPVTTAITLALLVGAIQVAAGALRLGVLVDYISSPVVVGYITGAGVLIGVGQLPALTETAGGSGNLAAQVWGWVTGLGGTDFVAVGIGVAVMIGILALRRLRPGFPAAIATLGAATALAWAVDPATLGVVTIGDLSPVPQGLPPVTLPAFGTALDLLPVAVAATVLSLVESSSVARAIAVRTGQRLDLNREFVGQGLANVAAAFTGGYPTSGSLSRSALNHASGARSRLAGVLSGVAMLLVLLVLGPVVDYTPIAALAGLLLVVAVDLVDVPRLQRVIRGRRGDAAALAATLIGTWTLPLDQAIYVGVAISLVLFLRRVRHLVVRRLALGPDGRLRELAADDDAGSCDAIRILHVEGQLFFAAASELEAALTDATADPRARVLIVRLKRTQGLDVTAAGVLAAVGSRMALEGRHLFLVGMRDAEMRLLRASGVEAELGADHLFPTQHRWFAALDEAVVDALEIVGEHACGTGCPLGRYGERRAG